MPVKELNSDKLNNDIPLLILNSNMVKEEVLNYIENGGCLLSEIKYAAEIFNIKTRKKYLKYLLPEKNKIFKLNYLADIYNDCSIPDQANLLEDQDSNYTTLELKVNKGKVIIFPSGFFSQIFNNEIMRKNFYSPYGSRETNERVSKVSKGMISEIVKMAVQYLYSYREIPFVTLWRFPNGYRNIFCFRIDTDFASLQEINDLYKILTINNINATWFVETKSAENFIKNFSLFYNNEIALHCYKHKVFSSYKDNYESVKKGFEILEKNRIKPKGFAAPYGEWNPELMYSLEDLNILYSSEFGYAYDSLPFYPYVQNKRSKVLQLPIHPISFNRLYWGGHSDEGIFNYYIYILEKKFSENSPVIFYTHPGDKRLEILEKIFQRINSENIPVLTIQEFADWWIERDKISWDIFIDNNNFIIKSNLENRAAWINIRYSDGSDFLAPLNKPDEKIKLPVKVMAETLDKNISKNLRKTNLRMIRHDILFYKRKLKQ